MRCQGCADDFLLQQHPPTQVGRERRGRGLRLRSLIGVAFGCIGATGAWDDFGQTVERGRTGENGVAIHPAHVGAIRRLPPSAGNLAASGHAATG